MDGANAQRVGEIFKTAGQAFNTLGQLTCELQKSSQQNVSKWTDQEIHLLAQAVQNFANDLQLISDTIRDRSVSQIKGALQKKAFDAAGIIVQSQPQPVVSFYIILPFAFKISIYFGFFSFIVLPLLQTGFKSQQEPNRMQTLLLLPLMLPNQKLMWKTLHWILIPQPMLNFEKND